jgi:hypothetical protein
MIVVLKVKSGMHPHMISGNLGWVSGGMSVVSPVDKVDFHTWF